MHFLGKDVLAGNGQLFLLRIAGQGNDLQTVAERAGDVLQMVRRADEQHLGEIERYVQVMIAEVEVLFRIQRF